MRVLLYRLAPGETVAPETVAGLVGQSVHARPGSARIVGAVRAAELRDRELYADIDLDAEFLPHELDLDSLSVTSVKQ